MTTITLRIAEEDKALIQTYAKLHGVSAADVLRSSALERIEDEYDLKELENAIATSDGNFTSHDEVMKKFGLR